MVDQNFIKEALHAYNWIRISPDALRSVDIGGYLNKGHENA
jgi:hypothetical protein